MSESIQEGCDWERLRVKCEQRRARQGKDAGGTPALQMKPVEKAESDLRIDLPPPFGTLFIRYRNGRLRSVRLVDTRGDNRANRLSGVSQAGRDERLEEKLRSDFQAYFAGQKAMFDYSLDMENFSPFQRAVWAAMRDIPYGETRSYQWIAQRIEKPRAARAVGNACGRNPIPIIQPCHRVVASNGKLGGFSGGLDLKKALLKLEGVDLSKFA